MLKSHVRSIIGVYTALFEDIAYALPQLKVDLEKDLERLRRTAQTRGVPTFVVDLPALGKHFDKCLASGKLHQPHLPLSQAGGGCALIPKFLRGLYKLVFQDDGNLKENYLIEAIIFLRQIFYLAKKLPLPFSPAALHASVWSLVEEDALLPIPEPFWSEADPSSCILRMTFRGFRYSSHYKKKVDGHPLMGDVSVFLKNLDSVSRLISAALGSYDPREWRFRHGPGAISQVSGPGHNKYQWYGWSDRLESVYPIAEYGFHNYTAWADKTHYFRDVSYTPASRLVAVPKTYEKPRLIAAEPSEHQWCQQNLWHYFRTNTVLTWLQEFVRFGDQTLNQELCRSGSRDGTLCTIDMSSASDRVSCHAVGNFFKSNIGLLNALRATRTDRLTQSLTSDLPSTLNLRKFSTMGSACTFPVQTMIFLGCSLAAVLTKRKLMPTIKNILALSGSVAVFGDDIIVPSDCRELLQSGLEVLDFKVNESKSFSEGFFRESCGVDCYRGVDVTPIYIKSLCTDTPESVASTVDSANNFYYKFYLRVQLHLESTLQRHKSLATVRAGSGHFGLQSRVGEALHRKRWNVPLQREEARILTVMSKTRVVDQEDDTALHQYFTEQPSPHTKWEAGIRQCPRLSLKPKWVDIEECR